MVPEREKKWLFPAVRSITTQEFFLLTAFLKYG